MTEKYTAVPNNAGLYCVDGPGDKLGYYAHTLYPQLSCNNRTEAERAAAIANIAHQAGYEQAQRDMRRVMGAKP